MQLRHMRRKQTAKLNIIPFSRIFHAALFIFAFAHFMTCPFTHAFDDGHIEYNCLEKKITNKYCKDDNPFILLIFFKSSQTDIFTQPDTLQKLSEIPSSNMTFNLSILSTIRLIL
jgi:hypothetical protein